MPHGPQARVPSATPGSDIGRVVAGGYCVGCGACAKSGSGWRIALNAEGFYQAKPDAAASVATPVGTVCPFDDASPDEDALGLEFLAGPGYSQTSELGRFLAIHAGHVVDPALRGRGSSGAIAKYILNRLLARGDVQAVYQVGLADRDRDGVLYQFRSFETPEDVWNGSRSAYYPVEMSGILAQIRATDRKVAVTAVPCFAKALRLLMREEPVLRERIVAVIGIVCGHLKSTAYAELLAWQRGIAPNELVGIDFRMKYDGRRANEKGLLFEGRAADGTSRTEKAVVQELVGTDYGQGFFKYRACDYCDDVVAELADVSIGDAWLPKYIGDGKGTSLVIVRNRLIAEILAEGVTAGSLKLDGLTATEGADSQAAGLRHRRLGLAYRLWLDQRAGRWAPRKRVRPSSLLTQRRYRAVQRMRIALRDASAPAFAKAKAAGSLQQFLSEIEPLVASYRRCYEMTPVEKFIHTWKRRIARRLPGAAG